MGMCSNPGRVFKGKVHGQVFKKVTVQNLEVVKIDAEQNLILVKVQFRETRADLLQSETA